MVLASFWFALMAVGIKYASNSFGTFELVFYRGLVSIVFMGIVVRAIVVGPIARLELLPEDRSAAGSGDIIEAQIGAQEYKALELKDGDTVVLTPRKARVFTA